METHISKELALWLKERGYKFETAFAYYGNAGEWNDALCDLSWHSGGDAEFREAKLLPAPTWYDILVTHTMEFWGKRDTCFDCFQVFKETKIPAHKTIYDGWECGCGKDVDPFKHPAYVVHSKEILFMLQEGEFDEAEAYVREHSVFASPKP